MSGMDETYSSDVEIDDEENGGEEPGLGAEEVAQPVMQALLQEYFSVMEKIKELEAGGNRMGDEVSKMLQAYEQMEQQNSPPASLQQAREVIEQAVIRLVDYWDGVATIHTALNQSLLSVL